QPALSHKSSASCKHITCEERNDYMKKTWTIEKKYDNSTLGVYLPDITIDELYDLEYKRNVINLHRVLHKINSTLCLMNDEIKLAYGIYVILHEVGHWLDFQASGKSSLEYNLWDSEFRNKCNEFVKKVHVSPVDIVDGLKHAKEAVDMYKNIPSEKAADKYAFENIKSKLEIVINLDSSEQLK
ncbi:MAG: hypothetical protein H6Q58_2056, partial [Firmicutes bacterium]|nr:hypothetical protein [Bacillota bacterium]